MAHFAKINDENEVLSVLTLDNKDMLNADGVEDESVGQQYLETHNNWPANQWIQCSYNTANNTHLLGGTPFRGNMASIGDTWDPVNQIFWQRQPFPSWVKNLTTARWDAPIGDPRDLTEEEVNDPVNVHTFSWNEENQSWDLKSYPRNS